LEAGQGTSADFGSFRAAQNSPLARRLFKIEGVTGVFFGTEFVTVTVAEGTDWSVTRPDVFSSLQEHYASGEPAVSEAMIASDTAILPTVCAHNVFCFVMANFDCDSLFLSGLGISGHDQRAD
jgi:hypothetical protein